MMATATVAVKVFWELSRRNMDTSKGRGELNLRKPIYGCSVSSYGLHDMRPNPLNLAL